MFVVVASLVAAVIIGSLISLVRSMRRMHAEGGSLADRPAAPDTGILLPSHVDRDLQSPSE